MRIDAVGVALEEFAKGLTSQFVGGLRP